MTEQCIFCLIAAGTVPSHRVYEDDSVVAFLDIAPIRLGHVQIIPKRHHICFDDLPIDLISQITTLAQRIAKVHKLIFKVSRVGFAFTGHDIAHAHAHVVPLFGPDDITSRRYIVEEVVTYRNPPRPSEAEMAKVADDLRAGMRLLALPEGQHTSLISTIDNSL